MRCFNFTEEIVGLRRNYSKPIYFFCEVKTPHTSAEITKRLLKEHSILIKDCNSKQSLENKNFIRIAIRNEIDNEQLIKAFKQL